MKITDVRLEDRGARPRLVAHVAWEDSGRPAQDIYYETDPQFAGALRGTPHPFLVAAAMPAMHAGERRICVEGEVCPELCSGLETAMSLVRHWFRIARDIPAIEARPLSRPHPRPTPDRAASFLTGGVDSLATLRWNRLHVPPEHPGSIRDVVTIFGLEIEDHEAFQHVLKWLSSVADDAGATLIPVYTNVRQLNTDWKFWYYWFMGAALASVGHALAARFSIISIASDNDIPNLLPHGSHPLMEPNFSSYDLRIRYDGITLSRLAKVRLLGDWDVAMQKLRVCNKTEHYRPGQLNCGRCEKCIRTMLALVAVGALGKATAFPHRDISEDVLGRLRVGRDSTGFPFYQELIAPLHARGRADLARGVERIVAPPTLASRWRSRIARLDRVYFKGGLRSVLRAGRA